MRWKVVPLEAEHLTAAVEVHIRAFPAFFLTFLGPRFLSEFYGSYLVDPTGLSFVALEEETRRLLGVVAGPRIPAGYFKRLLKRRWWAFGLASLGALARRPTILPRLVRAIVYRGDAPVGLARALLSSIAVDTDAQGEGVGKALLAQWVAEVQRRGGQGCYLTTDADDPVGANDFYRRCGWSVETTYTTHEGRRMNRYILDLPSR